MLNLKINKNTTKNELMDWWLPGVRVKWVKSIRRHRLPVTKFIIELNVHHDDYS